MSIRGSSSSLPASTSDRPVTPGRRRHHAAARAADDSRIVSVIAAETFSDLRTIVAERAPSFLPHGLIDSALERAARDGRFHIDDANLEAAAARINVSVLLIHGAADVDTPPDHSRRVFAGLKTRKQLIRVSGAGHNASLNAAAIWTTIEAWIESVVSRCTRRLNRSARTDTTPGAGFDCHS
jgi:pimeloyl-ACP methyl ester carboxylesterase